MNKFFLVCTILLTLATTTACKSGTANDTATTHEITWSTIEDKLSNEIPLDENDCMYILKDTTLDEGHSEGIGNYLFDLLCGQPKSNKLFINARKGFTKEEGDKRMLSLMDLMSIDIVDAEYDCYEEFLEDFPMFRNCAGAEELFNGINANGI